ncbi:hypothetical protein D3C72_1634090 [compost metagenome]
MDNFHEEYEDNKLELLGIVYNATTDYSPEESKSKQEVSSLANKYSWNIFDNEITYSRSYPKGAREGTPIFRTSYARTKQAAIFKKFADEFGVRVGL